MNASYNKDGEMRPVSCYVSQYLYSAVDSVPPL